MVLVIGDMLLMTAVDDSSVVRPFFPAKMIIGAIYHAQGPDPQRHQDILWKQVKPAITPCHLQTAAHGFGSLV